MTVSRRDAAMLAAVLAALAAVAVLYLRLGVSNPTTVSLTFLLVILVAATVARLVVAVVASFAAMLAFNYFFLPPVGTWSIADPQNWVALFAFLAVSLVASRLSAAARTRTEEAVARRNELARLFDLGRDVLMMTGGPEALPGLARSIGRRFDLELVAIALPREGGWRLVQSAAAPVTFDEARLAEAYAAAQVWLEFDARERTYAGHRTLHAGGREIRLVPLRAGTTPIGLLAAAGRAIEAGTLDTLAGLVAIAIERAEFLEERRRAELTRQSEELKTALLASLGHDLRTPLTAIRVAASNLVADAVPAAERAGQTTIILDEVDRLTRLFDNVLQMARIDAGAVTSETRWTHPSEIVAAAREQVGRALARHAVTVNIEPDLPVRVDPRLTSAVLAQLLENAAHYSPAGTTIDVVVRHDGEDVQFEVRDRGPGIAAADLPHLFERFYRGRSASGRPTGSGMGLWIARGLLAAQRGRIWVENCAGGGAQFTVAVPAPVKTEPESAEGDDTASPHPAGGR